MKAMTAASSKDHDRSGSAVEVLLAFAKLGVSCFGGPIAHIGYFRQEFVVRRRWLDEHAYADLVALCQFLPGSASSQVGFSLMLVEPTTTNDELLPEIADTIFVRRGGGHALHGVRPLAGTNAGRAMQPAAEKVAP